MTQQEIEQAADIAVENLYEFARQERDPRGSAYDEGYLDAIDVQGEFLFKEGAEYALNHQWISVDEELPPRNEDITYVDFSEHVLVRIDFEGNIIHRTACYDYANKRWTMYSKFVTHWMSIPPLEGGE